MNKNNDKHYTIPNEQLKDKSSWFDAITGRIKTDEMENFYENLPTKVSYKLHNEGKFYAFLKKLYKIYYSIVGPFHILPDFLILGSGACGTTSLLELYLRSNENILPSKQNEIYYFDRRYMNPINWYKILFPSIFTKKIRALSGKKTLTGEASGYIFDPNAAKRIQKIKPNVKFIVMLRNPVDRALSHYKRRIRTKREESALDKLIDYELNHYENELEEFKKNRTSSEDAYYFSPTVSYLARSRYFELVENWLKYFPKEQFLFINSNNYFKDPLTEYNKILEFLGLPSHHPNIKGKRGISPKELYDNVTIEPKTIEFLHNYFPPWNEKLFKLIDERYNWD